MKYINGHILRKIENWKNKKWYHQRFDGSPYLLHLIAEAEILPDKEKNIAGFGVHYCFFENGRADWYIEMESIKKIYTAVINTGKKRPNLSKELVDEWKKSENDFYKKCSEIDDLDLGNLSDTMLIKLHNEFIEIILSKTSSSSIIDGFALGTDELIANRIKEAYEKSDLKDKMKFTEVFSLLTAPVHISFTNNAEASLVNIALKIKEGENKEKLLALHQKNFFWLYNNYVDAKILSVDYFSNELDKIIDFVPDLEKEANKIKNTPDENKKRKKELFEKITIDDELLFLIRTSEDFTFWQDERKKGTFFNAHYCTLILDEIGKRVSIPSSLLKYMSTREVGNILKTKPSIEELKARKNNCVFFWDTEGHECISGREAEQVKTEILGETDFSDINDFRGLTASLGKANGKVKVVKSSKEINKVEKGDILVAVMTRPDYVPAMKKAAAIVTNEGGVTCHAAILARELGIPCIIGTKIATKVLKDGQIVEVNADHGLVKIIGN